MLNRFFGPAGLKPRVAAECDTASSLIAAIESGRGIALAISAFKHLSGKRLPYRPLAGTTEMFSVGIAREKNGDVTPAGEKFREIMRNHAEGCERGDIRSQGAWGPSESWIRVSLGVNLPGVRVIFQLVEDLGYKRPVNL